MSRATSESSGHVAAGAPSAPALEVRLLTTLEELRRLTPGGELGAYCRYRPGGTLRMLQRVLGAPQGRLLAALADEELVGFLALFQPGVEERWGAPPLPGLVELGALEVDRRWRRRGVSRRLLAAAFAGAGLDEAIVIAPQFAADWDLETTGLTWARYRQLVLRLFRRHGFADFVTDDPLIAADPRNVLLVRVGEAAPRVLYEVFRSRLTKASPGVGITHGRRRDLVSRSGCTAIQQVNQLTPEEREAIYARLVPPRVHEVLGLDPATGRDAEGHRLVSYVCPPDQGFVRIEVRPRPPQRDYVFLLKLTQPSEEFLEIAFIMTNDPRTERFDVDCDEAGIPVGILSGRRNVPEEVRALHAGLAPGQVRRGLRLFREALPLVESFAADLGKEQISIEGLFYHHAILYERHGFGYVSGRDRMEEIHQGFQPGGRLAIRLDAATAFRLPQAAGTVRGRSWAIRDGVLDEPWRVPRLYKIVGRRMDMPTFPDSVY